MCFLIALGMKCKHVKKVDASVEKYWRTAFLKANEKMLKIRLLKCN
jgi:hypothetical protein